MDDRLAQEIIDELKLINKTLEGLTPKSTKINIEQAVQPAFETPEQPVNIPTKITRRRGK